MSIIDVITVFAIDQSTSNVLVAVITGFASLLGAKIVVDERKRRTDAKNPQKTQQQLAVDVMVKSYDQSIETLTDDRDYWKNRALEAETKLMGGK